MNDKNTKHEPKRAPKDSPKKGDPKRDWFLCGFCFVVIHCVDCIGSCGLLVLRPNVC